VVSTRGGKKSGMGGRKKKKAKTGFVGGSTKNGRGGGSCVAKKPQNKKVGWVKLGGKLRSKVQNNTTININICRKRKPKHQNGVHQTSWGGGVCWFFFLQTCFLVFSVLGVSKFEKKKNHRLWGCLRGWEVLLVSGTIVCFLGGGVRFGFRFLRFS